jgi:DNA recombination protein RmuC
MMGLLFAVIGVLVGTLATYFIFNSKLAAMKAINEQANQQISKIQPLEEERMRLYGKSQADAKEIDGLNNQVKTLKEDKANMEGNLKQIMTDITNDSFIKQGKLLTDQQTSKLSDILDPLKEKIREFQTKVETNQTESTKTNSVLMEQIKQLTSLNQTVTQKTEDLSNALRGSTKAQGGWGEMILERVLERSGLKKGAEYETQFSTKNASGDIIRPDAVIYLPDNKNLIIDSKVSLTAYEQYSSSDEPAVKEAALKSHMVSIKGHIKLLSEKDYHTGLGLNSPDFTLMFIPIESGFALSIKEDITLFEYAWDRKIVLVSPSTLLATLRTIASVWKNENQTRNAVEIAQRAGDLYDKFVAFTDDMETVGKSIEKTDEAYHKAMNKLSVGKGNLVNRANQLKAMGINATKNINPKLVDDDPSA